MIAEAPPQTGDGTLLMLSAGANLGFFSHELPAASFILALERICQPLLQSQGVLHLLFRELDIDAVLRRNFCDLPLPLHSAGTRDARSIFLDGHLQSKEDRGFILVEHGDNAPTVDDRDAPIQRVRDIASLAIDCPDARRSDLVGNGLLLLLVRKPLLLEVGPVGAAVTIGRRPDMQCAWFQGCIEPPLIPLIRIAPSSKLRGRPRISLAGPVRYPGAEILRKCVLPPLLNGLF